MEATLRPYDRGEEVPCFTVPYHPTPIPFVFAVPIILAMLGGAEGSEQKRVSQRGCGEVEPRQRHPARLNSQM